jgi:glycerol kinase
LGAALFAGLAAGIYASVEDAAAHRPKSEVLRPSIESHLRESAYARWLDAVPRVRS